MDEVEDAVVLLLALFSLSPQAVKKAKESTSIPNLFNAFIETPSK